MYHPDRDTFAPIQDENLTSPSVPEHPPSTSSEHDVRSIFPLARSKFPSHDMMNKKRVIIFVLCATENEVERGSKCES
jgi:hypothetical protein